MRVATIFGLGTSPANLQPFRADSATQWIEGVPASSADADAILIFGGDGTIHRHLPAMVRLRLPVLVVPAGSGNDFARALKLRSVRDSVQAWRKFESGACNVRAIDLGTITETSDRDTKHYFACVAGCGLDTAVARSANRMPRWLRSHGGYALSLLPLLFKLPALPMRFTYSKGENHEEVEQLTLLAAFANTQYYGDGMRIAPQADPTDGKLDVCLISTLDPFRLFCLFPTVYFGRHLGISEVSYSKTEHLRVESSAPQEIYADGEYVCKTPVDIGVERGALKVITP
ncbi:MAG TPA: diacylglycerol kinase family protein [Terriglobales bacterium]|jgi:diacylglycerol kinase (ATP)|nr:diacylglycerol kinase family protein [Terriglobales bacterium]